MNEYLKEIEKSNNKFEKRTKIILILFTVIVIISTVSTIYNSSKKMINITVSTNGTIVSKETRERANLNDFFNKEKISIGTDDYIMLNEKYISTDDFGNILLESNDAITIQEVESKEETKQMEIKYKTQKKNTDQLFIGETKVMQKGKNGTRKVTYNVKIFEGKEVNRIETKSIVSSNPIDKIILVGTREKEVENTTTPNYPSKAEEKPSTSTQASTERKVEDNQQQNVEEQNEECTIKINEKIVPCNN